MTTKIGSLSNYHDICFPCCEAVFWFFFSLRLLSLLKGNYRSSNVIKPRLKGHNGLCPCFASEADFNRASVLRFQLDYKMILSFKCRDHSLCAKSSINRAAILRICQVPSIPLSGQIALHFRPQNKIISNMCPFG